MVFLFLIVGFASGFLSGLGLGGGTILIPLLMSIFSFSQKTAQLANIFSFIIMSIFVMYKLIKEKLILIFPALFMAIIGTLSAVFSAFFVTLLPAETLKIIFAIFLILVGIFELLVFLYKKYSKK